MNSNSQFMLKISLMSRSFYRHIYIVSTIRITCVTSLSSLPQIETCLRMTARGKKPFIQHSGSSVEQANTIYKQAAHIFCMENDSHVETVITQQVIMW